MGGWVCFYVCVCVSLWVYMHIFVCMHVCVCFRTLFLIPGCIDEFMGLSICTIRLMCIVCFVCVCLCVYVFVPAHAPMCVCPIFCVSSHLVAGVTGSASSRAECSAQTISHSCIRNRRRKGNGVNPCRCCSVIYSCAFLFPLFLRFAACLLLLDVP